MPVNPWSGFTTTAREGHDPVWKETPVMEMPIWSGRAGGLWGPDVVKPLCDAAPSDNPCTGDHIPQVIPKVVVPESVSARAVEQGNYRGSSTPIIFPNFSIIYMSCAIHYIFN